MSNPIDLATISQVQTWLSSNTSGLPVTSLALLTGGIGTSYDNSFVVEVIPIDGNGSGATVTGTASGGIVQSISLTAGGSGYTSEPLLVFPVTSGTPATAQAYLAGDLSFAQIITATSLQFLRITGRGPMNGSVPTISPFVEPVGYDEWYDGNGNQRQFVRNWPITEVTNVFVNGTSIPLSGGVTQPGYVIDGSGKSIVIRTIGQISPIYSYSSRYIGGGNYFFARGIQNVEIQYTAGFSGIPYDLNQACIQTVAQTVIQQSVIYMRSKALPMGGGTVVYGNPGDVNAYGLMSLAFPPYALQTLEYYKRQAIV
jgi:hypothetical protein